jgi:hypothetical protein
VIYLFNQDRHSPHVLDYHTNVLKQQGVPQKPRMTSIVKLKFKEKGFRDKFVDLLRDALSSRGWLIPFKVIGAPQIPSHSAMMV